MQLLLSCFWGFTQVKQSFFPTTSTPIFYIDYYLPQGTDILTTADEIASLEQQIKTEAGVTDITSFIGVGPSRFAATTRPEKPNTAYAHLVVRVEDVRGMNGIMSKVESRLAESNLEAEIQIRRAQFSPSGSSKIEARFIGADPDVLRGLADQALNVYLAHNLIDRKVDWRQRELQIVPEFNASKALNSGVTREDVYQSLAFATLGVNIGLYRDESKLLPIIARAPEDERTDLPGLSDRMVWSPAQQSHVPMSQVIDGFSLQPEDSLIFRRNRYRVVSALANPPRGENFTLVFESMRGDVEVHIPLPAGYSLEWGGEYEGSQEARETLGTKIPITFGVMFFVTLLMFGKLRQPIVIWLTVPMTVCGVVISLLVTDLSFTFPSFLGFLSLSGMLIKNCVVLVDEIDKRVDEEGMSH